MLKFFTEYFALCYKLNEIFRAQILICVRGTMLIQRKNKKQFKITF